jgi:hypothetical protein
MSVDEKIVTALAKRYLSHFDAVTRQKQEGLDGGKRR